MEVPRGLGLLVLIGCIIFGAAAFIGPLVIAAIPLDEIYPYGKYLTGVPEIYAYSQPQYFDSLGKLCLSVIVLTIVFGVCTLIFWILGRPSASSGAATIFRIIVLVCISCQVILLGVTVGLANTATYPYDYDLDFAFEYTEEEARDLQEWLNDKHPRRDDPRVESATYWQRNVTQKTNNIYYQFKCFHDINLVFAALAIIYWVGYLYRGWFEGGSSGSSSKKQRVHSQEKSSSSSSSKKRRHHDGEV